MLFVVHVDLYFLFLSKKVDGLYLRLLQLSFLVVELSRCERVRAAVGRHVQQLRQVLVLHHHLLLFLVLLQENLGILRLLFPKCVLGNLFYVFFFVAEVYHDFLELFTLLVHLPFGCLSLH